MYPFMALYFQTVYVSIENGIQSLSKDSPEWQTNYE